MVLNITIRQDEEMIFITLHPATEDQVPKTMRVAEEITRLRRETSTSSSYSPGF